MLRTLTALAVVGLAGCVTGPDAHPRDPLEPANRAIYSFNESADKYVMKPVAQGYRAVTPSFVRKGVNNFFSNLGDANSSFNYFLQGKPLPAYYSLMRFTLNSTAGVAGLFDVTGEQTRDYRQTNFGETLARWGWKDSNYLVLPLLGPSTARDAAGIAVDSAFQRHAIYGNPHPDALALSAAAGAVSTRERLLGVEDTIGKAALDPYTYTRDAWLEMRAKKTGDKRAAEQDDFSIDDLVE